MINDYTCCRLCPRECGADRTAADGYCGQSSKLYAAKAYLHMWEEPCISGSGGSGTIFFTGCSLKCVYCQNREIALGRAGFEIDEVRLGKIFLELQQKGAHNINLVTPTHYARHIIRALDLTRGKLNIPVIYNCGGYESVSTLKMLDGYIDIYLPDFKYMDSALAEKYSSAPDYPETAMAALDEMARQTVRCLFDENGIMKRGMIIRHLVLPSHTENAKSVIEYVHKRFGNDVYLSIMNQYTPMKGMETYESLSRRVTKAEYDEVIDFAVSIGVENAFIQEGGTVSESFIPLWDGEGIV